LPNSFTWDRSRLRNLGRRGSLWGRSLLRLRLERLLVVLLWSLAGGRQGEIPNVFLFIDKAFRTRLFLVGD